MTNPRPTSDPVRFRLVLTTAAMLLTAAASAQEVAQATAPDCYVKKATWLETLIASREALMRSEAEAAPAVPAPKAFEPFRATIGYKGKPQPLKVRVAGAKRLYLGAHATGEIQAVARGLRLVEPDGATVLLELRKILVEPKSKLYTWEMTAKPQAEGKQAKRAKREGDLQIVNKEIPVLLDGRYEWLEGSVAVSRGREGDQATFWATPGPMMADRERSLAARKAIWEAIARDFPITIGQPPWSDEEGFWSDNWRPGDLTELAGRYARACQPALRKRAAQLAAAARSPADLLEVRKLYRLGGRLEGATAQLQRARPEALRQAIADLAQTFPVRYPKGAEFLRQLDGWEKLLPEMTADLARGDEGALDKIERFLAFRREALLSNPLLDFDRMLVVRRIAGGDLGLPANWKGNTSLRGSYDNDIAVLSPIGGDGALTTLYKPVDGRFVGDVDLHYDADRLLFSMPGDDGKWHVWEVPTDAATPTAPRQVTPKISENADNFDGCYLPDGRIVFTSTAYMQGVPCVGGSEPVANLALVDPDGQNLKMLTFEQDHNWCPSVLDNGRVMYLRWEYSDVPHAFSRILFDMNPDGTAQMAYYGSNSYWPNGIWYARGIPGRPGRAVGIVSGHHGIRRAGEMVVFDRDKAQYEADGVVQRIGDYGKPVEPVILDDVAGKSWPKFLHPYPLGDGSSAAAGKYFLAAAQPTSQSLWGIYLVDAFDNMVLLKQQPGYALLEPLPFRKTATPPIVPDRTELSRTDAIAYVVDVYRGGGLAGVPRGAIKKLRVFTYHFAYRGMGGQGNRVGTDGPWDIKRVMGTVAVEADGSAMFRIPANTPISIQPLDAEGRAVQRMRSWFAAMPGETLSCVGCHENHNTAPPTHQTLATRKDPAEIEPWRGPVRGFSFRREIQQPLLDKYCIGCHDGRPRPDGGTIPDLRDAPDEARGLRVMGGVTGGGKTRTGKFSPSYWTVRSYVRTVNETDFHMLAPYEFHADSTHLVRMLQKGHHNVQLDAEAWDRLATWIDLGAPAHGTWTEIVGAAKVEQYRQTRLDLRKLYGNADATDPEAISEGPPATVESIVPEPLPEVKSDIPHVAGWPFDADEARRRQAAAGAQIERTIDLGKGADGKAVQLKLTLIPSGQFVMGDAAGHRHERPCSATVGASAEGAAFWMGQFEITNAQYALFDPTHDSRLEHLPDNHFTINQRGALVNGPAQPVCRVTQLQAAAFCLWLSRKTGLQFSLPTEAQWEYACRAGSDAAFGFGPAGADHSGFANFADASHKKVLQWLTPPAGKFDDGVFASADVGRYRPNAWGLRDMHGNVAEWTRTAYRPYPYRDDDGRNAPGPADKVVVRGGSWSDHPDDCRSAARRVHRRFHGVFDVGFRVVCQVE